VSFAAIPFVLFLNECLFVSLLTQLNFQIHPRNIKLGTGSVKDKFGILFFLLSFFSQVHVFSYLVYSVSKLTSHGLDDQGLILGRSQDFFCHFM
jgi:hypothetical protein